MHNQTSARSDPLERCFFCHTFPIFLPLTLGYALVSGPAQLWVLVLMVRSPDFGTDKMEVFHFHLALSEVIFALLAAPAITATYAGSITSTFYVLTLGEILVVVRNELQSVICLEHYLAVVHPVQFLRYRTLRNRLALNGLVVAKTIVFVATMMATCNLTLKLNLYSCIFAITLCWNAFLGVAVLRALRRPSPGRAAGTAASNLAKRRAFNIVLIYQLVIYLSYTPMMVGLVLVDVLGHDLMCVFQLLAYCLMLWLGVVSPLLYLRRSAKHLFLKR